MSTHAHGSGEYVRGSERPILIADDDPTFVELLTTILTREGYGVVSCRNAEKLMTYLATSLLEPKRQLSPALVILDVCMPNQNGIGALRCLRKGNWIVPTIIVTGRERADDERAAHDLGAVAFFKKPIEVERLLDAVRHHVVRARRGEPDQVSAHVLVADDDADLRALISAVLKQDGHDVLEARDGAETLGVLANSLEGGGKTIDVMLLDIRMPAYSGLGVLLAMRGHSTASMPVAVVITSMADPSFELLARRHGAFGVLKKPFDVDDLRTVVANAVRFRDARQDRIECAS